MRAKLAELEKGNSSVKNLVSQQGNDAGTWEGYKLKRAIDKGRGQKSKESYKSEIKELTLNTMISAAYGKNTYGINADDVVDSVKTLAEKKAGEISSVASGSDTKEELEFGLTLIAAGSKYYASNSTSVAMAPVNSEHLIEGIKRLGEGIKDFFAGDDGEESIEELNNEVTLKTILDSIGLGAKDTLKENWEAIKSLFTKEGWESIAEMFYAFGPGSWADDRAVRMKFEIAEGITNSIENTYNEFVEGNANVKAYYISKIGTEIFLSIVGTKGTQYVTKTVKAGKLGTKAANIVNKIDEITMGNKWKQVVTPDGTTIRVPVDVDESIVMRSLDDVAEGMRHLNYNPTSGAKLVAKPNKTTTIIGRYSDDMAHIIDELGVVETNLNGLSGNKGGFNVLNITDDYNYATFWYDYNEPFMQAAISRGDDIIAATDPSDLINLYNKGVDISMGYGGYGKEVSYLLDNGYYYDDAISMFKTR